MTTSQQRRASRGRWWRAVPDGFDHAETHLHTAVGVVLPGLGQAGHAVVAVTQDLDPQTVVLLQEDRKQRDAVSPLASDAGEHRKPNTKPLLRQRDTERTLDQAQPPRGVYTELT